MSIKRRERYVFVFMVVACLLLTTHMVNATDSDGDGIDDATEQTLAETYAPVLYFEKNEKVFPVAIEYHVSNSNLNKSEGGIPVLIDANPSVEELSDYTDISENYYLDNRKGTIEDDGIINDYRENMATLGYTVYVHIFEKNGETFIQYWLFYAFNQGTLNTHEGDWEMVQVVLNETGKPVEAMYSQHVSGQRAPWSEVQKSGDHPKVYVARGSHANYFRYYQGKLGLASDYVGKNGRVLKPDAYTLVLLGEQGIGNHISQQNWIDFAGRWGDFGGEEDEVRGKRGPYGPAYRENGDMWAGMEWGESLPSLNTMWLRVEWFFYHFTTIYLAILALSLAGIIFAIYRKHKKDELKKPFLYLLKIDGINMRSIGNILAIIGIIVAISALFYQWYGVEINIPEGSYKTPGPTEIITIDGTHGIQINLLEEGKGMIQAGAFPIAFSLLVGAAIIFFILGTIGLERNKAWKKYMMRGVKFLVPVVLIIVAVMSFGMLAFQLNETGASAEAKEDAVEIINTISSHPFGGDTALSLPDYGDVQVTWGMGPGAYLLILSGILLIVSGALHLMAVKERE